MFECKCFRLCTKHRHLDVFSTCTNPIIHLFIPPKICVIIVYNFPWDMKISQGKSKTMPMPFFFSLRGWVGGGGGGVKEVYYGTVQVENKVKIVIMVENLWLAPWSHSLCKTKQERRITQAAACIRRELDHLSKRSFSKTRSTCINGSRLIHDQWLAFVLVVVAIGFA